MFEFDEDVQRTYFASAANVDLMYGNVTLYAVLCVGDGEHPESHGGQLTFEAEEALHVAKEENRLAAEEGSACHYIASAVGIPPEGVLFLADLIMHGPKEVTE